MADQSMLADAIDALWNELCPGIRQTPEDREFYAQAVRAVLVSIDTPTDGIWALVDEDDPPLNLQNWRIMLKGICDGR